MPPVPPAYTPPNQTPANVLYGVGNLFTAATGTALPSDANLGVASAWTALSWNYIGATDQGIRATFNPRTVNITIEEQPIPVAVLVDTADLTLTTSIAEETLTNINMAYGNSGTIAVTAPGAGQPGKSVLTLSTNFAQIAAAVIGRNQFGFARVMYIPIMMSAGQVQTDWRRSQAKRMWPLTLNSVTPLSTMQFIDLTAAATS
jgi:hypothetical protein